jgi:pumilio homology domain family member 6
MFSFPLTRTKNYPTLPTMAAAPSSSNKRKGSAEGSDKKPFTKKPKFDDRKKPKLDDKKPKFDNKKPKFDKADAKKPTVAADGEEKSSTAQKRALKQERQSHRRHADVVMEAKDLWNKLRLKTNTPEETRQYMVTLMELIRGKIPEIALQHDASRVVQAAIQFGTPEERKEVVVELCAKANIPELSKVQYAHFVVLKMIKYCDRQDDCVKLIVKSLKGSIPKLAVHAVGARVLELLFNTFPPKTTAMLKQEFYGPHFSLFAAGDVTISAAPSLVGNLKTAPEKKAVTLEFVVSILNKGIEKGLFAFVYLQELFCEYVTIAPPNDIRNIASSVVDHSVQLLSTRAGTRVVVACATYGTAKDRKRILKSLKGYTRSSLMHRDAYLAILRVVQVTDDTVSVHKSVLAELMVDEESKDETKNPLLSIALDENASKLFLMLLVANEETRQKYFDPLERQVLDANPTVTENGEEVLTSKKNPETRRKELVQYLRKPLIDLCVAHPEELLRSIAGARVLREVYAAFRPTELVDAVVKVCEASADTSKDATTTPLFEDRIGQLAVKNLIMSDAEPDEKDADPLFSHSFVKVLGGKKLLANVGASNRGAFVLTSLCKVKAVRAQVLKALSSHTAQFKKSMKGSDKAAAGYDALLKELDTKK